MTTKLSTEKKEDYLYIREVGIISGYDEWWASDKRIFDTIIKYNSTKIVLNQTEVTFPEPKILNAYKLVQSYVKEFPVEAYFWRLAVVVNSKDNELAEFWEIACKNRGYKWRVFLKLNDAIEWVKIK
jgi:hypothetical protein